MAQTSVTTHRFTGESLAQLQRRDQADFLRRLRERAFEQFEATPMPSPETEEWRYTDLRHLDLAAFSPLAEEAPAQSLDEVKPELLEAAGEVGDRAGLQIQHNSSVVTTHLDPEEAAKGVVLASLDQ